MTIISLFTGAGGLDLGFHRAGFEIIYMNEFDKSIIPTLKHNFTNIHIDKRSIVDVKASEVPDCVGIIGGPPCQSWSEAGSSKGIEDKRGQLFFEYIRIIKEKQPLFFVAENVSGMLAQKHSPAMKQIKRLMREAGYNLFFSLLNVADYGLPQNRKRLFFVGFRTDLGIEFTFPKPTGRDRTLYDAIGDLEGITLTTKDPKRNNIDMSILRKTYPKVSNHEYFVDSFSPQFMSRNRVKNWGDQSFTIPASGRHVTIHPSANKMKKIDRDHFEFEEFDEVRRFTVRETARIQTFPDSFYFKYQSILDGYKMVGNAVPPDMAEILAKQIYKYLTYELE